MDQVYDQEEASAYVDPDHIGLVFDGLLDTVSGSESLTAAQVYLNGVMLANGIVTRREIAGNEGIFQSIGDGLKKVWEYIKSLFRKIFGGEKKKEAETQIKKLDDKIDKVEKKIEKVSTPAAVAEEVKDVDVLKKYADAIQKKTAHLKPSQAQKDVDKSFQEVRESIDALSKKADTALKNIPPSKEQTEALYKMLEKSFEAGLYRKDIALQAADRMKNAVTVLQAMKAEYEKLDDKGAMAGSIQRFINGLTGLSPIEAVSTLQGAEAWIRTAKRCKEAMGNTWMEIFGTQNVLKKRISELEGEINHFDKTDNQDELKKKIQDLKTRLTDVVNVDANCSTVVWSMNSIIDTIEKAIIVKTE